VKLYLRLGLHLLLALLPAVWGQAAYRRWRDPSCASTTCSTQP
jgi:hypothetical protein